MTTNESSAADPDGPAPGAIDVQRRRIIGAGMALGLAVGVLGVAFGVLAATAGLPVWQAVTLSAGAFTGASQFAAVSVLASGGSGGAALGVALLLAARNGVYALSVSGLFAGLGWRRWLAAHLVIDESTAMANAHRSPRLSLTAFLATGLSVLIFWNVGTLIGATLGTHLGQVTTFGLDAAFPAAFISLLREGVDTPDGRRVAVVAVVLTLASIPLLPPGLPVLTGGLGAMAAWALTARRSPTDNATHTTEGIER